MLINQGSLYTKRILDGQSREIGGWLGKELKALEVYEGEGVCMGALVRRMQVRSMMFLSTMFWVNCAFKKSGQGFSSLCIGSSSSKSIRVMVCDVVIKPLKEYYGQKGS